MMKHIWVMNGRRNDLVGTYRVCEQAGVFRVLFDSGNYTELIVECDSSTEAVARCVMLAKQGE